MRKLSCIVLSLALILSFSAVCFAEPGNVEEGKGQDTMTQYEKELANMGLSEEDVSVEKLTGAENVSIPDLQAKLEAKGDSVISLEKIIASYVLLGAFIVCMIGAGCSAFMKNGRLTKFLGGAIIAGLAYAGVVYGEEIMAAITAFAKL